MVFLVCFSHSEKVFSEQHATLKIDIPSTFNPVGSGARAIGMGGAFIAVADDATAASWNPAGLIQVEQPESSIVIASILRTEDNTFAGYSPASGDQPVGDIYLNYLSQTSPLPFYIFDRNGVLSINIQRLYEFNRKWEIPIKMEADGLVAYENVSLDQRGCLSAIGISYSVRLSPQIAFGMTMNIWDDLTGINVPYSFKKKISQKGYGINEGRIFLFDIFTQDEFSFRRSALNFNFGFLWNSPELKFTIGGVYKTGFNAYFERKCTFDSTVEYPDTPVNNYASGNYVKSKETLAFPCSYGIGTAWRPSDEFTVSFDIYKSKWKDFELKDSEGNRLSPVSGQKKSETEIDDDTHQMHFGLEYLFVNIDKLRVFPLRLGVYYDPAPADGSIDKYYGASIGTGLTKKTFCLDIAYQYRYGKNVRAYLLESYQLSQNVQEHTFYVSLIYKPSKQNNTDFPSHRN